MAAAQQQLAPAPAGPQEPSSGSLLAAARRGAPWRQRPTVESDEVQLGDRCSRIKLRSLTSDMAPAKIEFCNASRRQVR